MDINVFLNSGIWVPLLTLIGTIYVARVQYQTKSVVKQNKATLEQTQEALITNGKSEGKIGKALDDHIHENQKQHTEMMRVLANTFERLEVIEVKLLEHISKEERAEYEQELRRAGLMFTRSTDNNSNH